MFWTAQLYSFIRNLKSATELFSDYEHGYEVS